MKTLVITITKAHRTIRHSSNIECLNYAQNPLKGLNIKEANFMLQELISKLKQAEQMQDYATEPHFIDAAIYFQNAYQAMIDGITHPPTPTPLKTTPVPAPTPKLYAKPKFDYSDKDINAALDAMWGKL